MLGFLVLEAESFASHATSPLDVKRRALHQILLWSSAQWERR